MAISTLLWNTCETPKVHATPHPKAPVVKAASAMESGHPPLHGTFKISFNTFVCKLLQTRNMPQGVAAHIAENGYRPSTIMAFNTGTRRWVEFCRTKKWSYKHFSLNQCLEYLQFLHKNQQLPFSAIRTAKSFIAAMVKLSLTQMSQAQMGCIYRYVQGISIEIRPLRKL